MFEIAKTVIRSSTDFHVVARKAMPEGATDKTNGAVEQLWAASTNL